MNISILKNIQKEDIPQLALSTLKCGLFIYILFFPLSRGLREFGSILSLLALIVYYLFAYEHSNLKKFDKKIYFFIFIVAIIISSINSINIEHSLHTLKRITYKEIFLFLYAIEAIRTKKDITIFIGCFSTVLLYVGLDSLYEFIFGYDIFFHASKKVAMFSHVSYATIISVIAPLTFCFIPIIVSSKKSNMLIYFIFFIIPIYFFIYTSDRRTGWIALIAATIAWFFLRKKKLPLFIISIIAFLTLLVGINRFNIQSLTTDIRWEIWKSACYIFTKHPFFGSGLNTYEFSSLLHNVRVYYEGTTFISAHNIYLIGFLLFVLFCWSIAYSLLRKIKKLPLQSNRHAVLSSFFCCFIAFLIASISGLNFYRPIYIGPSFILAGIGIACTIIFTEEHKHYE